MLLNSKYSCWVDLYIDVTDYYHDILLIEMFQSGLPFAKRVSYKRGQLLDFITLSCEKQKATG